MLTEKLSADRIQLLPSDDGNEECEAVNNQKPCGRAGDIRAAEQPVLTALHTIFVNEHNRIARELSQINPGWDDERLYQEARKIVGGILQNIVYREWLIPVLNKDIVDKYRINILEGYAGYNATVSIASMLGMGFCLGLEYFFHDIFWNTFLTLAFGLGSHDVRMRACNTLSYLVLTKYGKFN